MHEDGPPAHMVDKRLQNNCIASTRYGNGRRAERGLRRGWLSHPVAALQTATGGLVTRGVEQGGAAWNRSIDKMKVLR